MSNADPSAPDGERGPGAPDRLEEPRTTAARAHPSERRRALARVHQLVGQHAPWAGSRYAVVIGWLLTRLVMVLLLLGLDARS